MYCTKREIGYLIGPQYLTKWSTIKQRIDHLNKGASPDRQIRYYLRKNQFGPFDIQVCFDSLPPGHKGYIAYRHSKDREATIPDSNGDDNVFPITPLYGDYALRG